LGKALKGLGNISNRFAVSAIGSRDTLAPPSRVKGLFELSSKPSLKIGVWRGRPKLK